MWSEILGRDRRAYSWQQTDSQAAPPWLVRMTPLNAREHQQAVVTQLSLLALSINDLDELMTKAVSLVADTLDMVYGKVLELLPDGRTLRLRWGVGWEEGVVGTMTVGVDTGSQEGYTLLSQAALLSKDPVIVTDLRSDTRFHNSLFLREHGVISGLSVVIQGPSKPFGVMGVYTTTLRRFTQDDVNFAQTIANVLAGAIARLEMERVLRENETRLQPLVTQIPSILWATDRDLRLTFLRGAALRALEVQPDQFIGSNLLEYFPDTPISAPVLAHRRALAGFSSDYQATYKERIFHASVKPLRDTREVITGCIGVAMDITDWAQAEGQSGWHVRELQGARAETKVPRKLLPICSSCKMTRDEHGGWTHIEKYICAHSDVQFTHGLCPDCFHHLYPNLCYDAAASA